MVLRGWGDSGRTLTKHNVCSSQTTNWEKAPLSRDGGHGTEDTGRLAGHMTMLNDPADL